MNHKESLISSVRTEISSSLAWFVTDNALCPGVDQCSSSWRHQNWEGRISRYISPAEAEPVMKAFLSPDRDKHFRLFFVSDYKDTYWGE